MCYEHFDRRRRREADESRELWQDFERTKPIVDPKPQAEASEAERADLREEVPTPEH